jgi:hypothetical protein
MVGKQDEEIGKILERHLVPVGGGVENLVVECFGGVGVASSQVVEREVAVVTPIAGVLGLL